MVQQLNRDYSITKLQLKDLAFRTFKLKYTVLSNEDIATKYNHENATTNTEDYIIDIYTVPCT